MWAGAERRRGSVVPFVRHGHVRAEESSDTALHRRKDAHAARPVVAPSLVVDFRRTGARRPRGAQAPQTSHRGHPGSVRVRRDSLAVARGRTHTDGYAGLRPLSVARRELQPHSGVSRFRRGYSVDWLRAAGADRRVKNGLQTTVANDSNYGQLAAVA